MRKKILYAAIVLFLLGTIAWTCRVQIIVWALPSIMNFTQPVAPHREVIWPDGPSSSNESIENRKPNIILILADDMGFNDVSLYNGGAGDGSLMTPNIDRIGNEGVIFNNGYAASASCSPSRASIMTGRYSTRFGYEFTPFYKVGLTIMKWMNETNDESLKTQFSLDTETNFIGSGEYAGMPSSEITVAEILREQGYYNAHIGKWHLGQSSGTNPTSQGFDDSLQLLSAFYLPKNDPNVVNAHTDAAIDRMVRAAGQFSVTFNAGEAFEPGGYITDYYTEEAVKVIEKNKHQPFFLYLGHFAPHNPLQSLKEDYDHFSHLSEKNEHELRVYSGMLRALDRGVGKILDTLEEQGLSENTLIIFSSDNGGANYINLSDINKPFRGWKLSHFEGGMHIPFMAKWPGKIKPGTIFDYPIHQNDILPTIAAAAEASIPTDRIIDGKNILPFIENNQPPHETLFWRQGRLQTVLHKEWKMISDTNQEKLWLFDLSKDPTEKNNLANQMPEKVQMLENLLMKHNDQQMEPNFSSIVATPILIDKHAGEEYEDGDEYIFWDN